MRESGHGYGFIARNAFADNRQAALVKLSAPLSIIISICNPGAVSASA